MMANLSLANLTFVNTRPAHQAETLNQLLVSHGANTIHFPTLEIESINARQTKAICQSLNTVDTAIFVSANAAHASHAYWPSPFPITSIIAIGPGTQKTLQQYGLSNITLPKHYHSEGILCLPALTAVQDKHIILFCGEHSKSLLYDTLLQQGATITVCECYRRVCPTLTDEALALVQAAKPDGIISMSKESLENLNLLLKNNPVIKKTPLIVISTAMAAFAKTQGWETVIVSPNASHHTIVETLAKLKNIT